jgi:uncharacterized membrane protein YdbT with pleckstrin-like domain
MSETGDVRADIGEEAGRYVGALGVGEEANRHELEVTDRSNAPRQVRRWLIPDERQVLAIHYHPAIMARETAALAVTLAVALAVNAAAYPSSYRAGPADLIYAAWILFGVAALWYTIRAVAYRRSWLIITPVRILTIRGVLSRHVAPLPMKRIRDMQMDQTMWGRILGYGALKTESLGTDHALSVIRFVPEPDQVYQTIWSILLPKAGTSPMPDEVS